MVVTPSEIICLQDRHVNLRHALESDRHCTAKLSAIHARLRLAGMLPKHDGRDTYPGRARSQVCEVSMQSASGRGLLPLGFLLRRLLFGLADEDLRKVS